jgi:hypothetical protein
MFMPERACVPVRARVSFFCPAPAGKFEEHECGAADAKAGIRGLANEWRVRLSRFIFG